MLYMREAIRARIVLVEENTAALEAITRLVELGGRQ